MAADPTDPGFRFLPRAGREAPAADRARDALAAAGLTPRLDRATALSFLGYGEYQAYHSFFEGLATVPMRCPIEDDARRGPTVDDGRAPAPLDEEDAADPARALRNRIERAVADAIGDEQVAVWLSGGSDSAAVAAAAAGLWRQWQRDPADLRFYHQQSPHGNPETPAAQALADTLGHELVIVRDAPGDPLEGVASYLGTLDNPIDGPGCAQMLAFAARQAEDGVGLFLTGDGGDECFGPRQPDPLLRRWLRASLPAPALRRYRRRQLPGWLRASSRDVRDLEHVPRARRGLRGMAAERDQAIRCARQSALVGVHRATAARFGMRAAFPLLAPDVVDLAVAVPQAEHGDPIHPKRLLKAAFADRLPAAALARTKADQPYAEGAVAADVERFGPAWRTEWLDGGRLETDGLISHTETATVLASAGDGPRALYRVFALLGLEIWLRAWDLPS